MSVRALATLLGISVVLNVLFVGVWAGQWVRHGHGTRGAETFDGHAMRGVWKRHDAMLRPRSEALEASRRKETDGAQRALHRALVDSARDLSPEDRRQMATSGWLVGPGPRRGR